MLSLLSTKRSRSGGLDKSSYRVRTTKSRSVCRRWSAGEHSFSTKLQASAPHTSCLYQHHTVLVQLCLWCSRSSLWRSNCLPVRETLNLYASTCQWSMMV